MGGLRRPGPALLLLLLLLPRDAPAAPEPQYLVFVPSSLFMGVPQKACILLGHMNETVALSVTLEYGGQNINLLTNMVTKKNSFYCSPLTVPVSSQVLAFMTVQVIGATQHFVKRKRIHLRATESLIFVQTDKPIYKPEQTVKFRIVSVDMDFRPLDETFPVVHIENPQRNRIVQWKNLKLPGGLRQLSFPLSTEPMLGLYTVMVQKASGRKVWHPFEVKEYVLPKFEVQVKMPKTIAFTDEELTTTVCGQYTYGKPVQGLVTMKVCRKYSSLNPLCQNSSSRSICKEFAEETDNEGCVTQVVKTEIFRLKQRGFDMSIQVEATIKEEGTELELTEQGSCEITEILSRVTFTKVDSDYRPGTPFFGQVLLVDEKNKPLPNKTVTVQVGQAYNSSLTTNEHGLADISIDTSNFTDPNILIQVLYKSASQCYDTWWLEELHMPAMHSIGLLFSRSNSYIHLELLTGSLACGQSQRIRAHYVLNGTVLKDEKELTFYYLIKAKGRLAQSGTKVLPIEQGKTKGVFSFSIQVGSNIAPLAQLLVYAVLPTGEMIADHQTLEVEKCFANKVTVSFSAAQGLPASDAGLTVAAAPHSLCGLRTVDQSVLLMKPEAELSPQSVYNLLSQYTDSPEYPDFLNGEQEHCISMGRLDGDGIPRLPVSTLSARDLSMTFQVLGLNVYTNTKFHKPRICQYAPIPVLAAAPVPFIGAGPPGFGGVAGVAGPLGVPGIGFSPGFGISPGFPHLNVPAGLGGAGSLAASPGSALPRMDFPGVPMGHLLQMEAEKKEIIRKYFPETWLWDLVVLNASGRSELAVKIPDTVTEWKADALCLSRAAGLGLAPVVSLRAFQPFFLELTLPYSVVRGEAFTLRATVFNYLPHCIRVRVRLGGSHAFLASLVGETDEPHCICRNGQKTVSWAVTPTSLGKENFTATVETLQSRELCGREEPRVPVLAQKDTVIRPLTIEPEGIEREETFNTVLCASERGEPETLSLKVPSNVVEGSARATFSVVGDILGSAMQNLQNLIQMPFGCGEQNMILFAPNIYVLSYLTKTQQLTETIKAKAIDHLISGYQRQLNYRHSDGSYSTFGGDDNSTEGSTWLTAFVLKSFVQAQAYIFVEDSHLASASVWLLQKQKESGCFQRSGWIVHEDIKGGVDDEATLSAYVTIALLEMPLHVTHPVVLKALSCLDKAWTPISRAQGSHVYTKALLAYAFALAGNQARRNQVLASLDRDAVTAEDTMHWPHPGKPKQLKTLHYQPRAPSVEVEMTAYVLLAYLTGQPGPSLQDLAVASRIVKWITKQQNPHGGFASTQDTVVALQALAKYGAMTFTKRQKTAVVTVKSSDTFSKEFQVDEGNRLLLQEVGLPQVPGEYSTSVAGSGCVYLQTSLRYNVLPKKEGDVPFTLKVDTVPKDCAGADARQKTQIHVNVSYTGARPASNMAIADVKMVSGFIPVKASVKKLQERPEIQRTEVSSNHVLIYIEKLTSQVLSFSFSVEQSIQVRNLKPANVKVYDYYETDEFAVEEYTVPCSAEPEQEIVRK